MNFFHLFFFCAHDYEHALCCAVPAGPLVYFLQHVDGSLSRASPFAAVGVVVGTIYWSAVTYGAVTVMQVSEPTARIRSSSPFAWASALSPSRVAGGRPQEGSVRDGASGPALPAHGAAHHPRGAGPGEDDPLGGLLSATVAEILLQNESPTR